MFHVSACVDEHIRFADINDVRWRWFISMAFRSGRQKKLHIRSIPYYLFRKIILGKECRYDPGFFLRFAFSLTADRIFH